MLQAGVGATKGVFKLGMGGWVGVGTSYLASPPSPHLRRSSRARSVLDTGVGRGGRGRGRSRHRRAPLYPPSLGTPRRNSAEGRGVEGGVISSHYQTRPYPSSFPSLALTSPKGQWLGWERGRGRGGGNTSTSLSANRDLKDRLALAQIFFWEGGGLFFSIFLMRTGRNAAEFFFYFSL